MKIYIVDPIGIHSGMKYYLDSFKDILSRIEDVEIQVLSNYSDSDHSPFFENFYKEGSLIKLFRLCIGILKLWTHSIIHYKSVFIVLSYGTIIDYLLIRATWSKCKVIDVHEVIVQGSEQNKTYKYLFSKIFSKQKTVIYHSQRAKKMFDELGFKGKSFFVPHFEYSTDAVFDTKLINKKIYNSIKADKINILFFGNITYSKGIDIFINSINTLDEYIQRKLNVIIAGKTLDDSFNQCETTADVFCVSIQHLNDDEMKYLYSHTDYVVLPYRQTSQSGILEMAFHYKKPVIASNIPYFNMMLGKYPSFGLLTELDATSLKNTWSIVSNRDLLLDFYKEEDIVRYETRNEDAIFIEQFSAFLQDKMIE